MPPRTLVVVGVGSIGSKHFSRLKKNFDVCVLVDPNLELIKRNLETIGTAEIVYLDSIDNLMNASDDHLAIVSNLAPDHLAVINALAQRNYRNILVEKPLCDSIFEIHEIKKLQSSLKLNIYVNLPWAYSSAARSLESNEHLELIGEAKSVVVTGGAKCLSTNGIHYISFANTIFKSKPSEVVASLDTKYINPRRGDLRFIGGGAIWTYPENRHLSINFHNESRVSIRIEIICEFGKIIFDHGKFHVELIEKNMIDASTLTKTFYPKVQSDNHILSQKLNMFDGTQEVYDLFNEVYSQADFEKGIYCTEALISALVASESKSTININDLIEGRNFQKKKWLFS
jgi:predicted dehydrogenase